MDRIYVLFALIYGLVGLLLGTIMAATHNHGQLVTHAHIMLVGFVVSFIYGVMHKVWLPHEPSKWAKLQLISHQLGTFIMVVALFCLYGGFISGSVLGPVLGVSSLMIIFAMLLMMWLFVKKS